MNNIGGAVSDKFAFQQKHKFSIAFENTSYCGYCTEKIVEAFAAGTIPIYWGDPRVAEDFNENAFVNCHNYETLDDIVARVKEIDENDKLCLSMLNESIVKYKDGDIESYLFHILINLNSQHLEDQSLCIQMLWKKWCQDIGSLKSIFISIIENY